MKLSQLVSASNAAGKIAKRVHSILIYGPPKVGKTELAATVAKIPSVRNVYYFGGENGHETIIGMYHRGKLTMEQLDKIILVNIPDTREQPTFIETCLKAIASRNAVKICEDHGKVACAVCAKASGAFIDFDHKSLTEEDVIIVDSGSQLGVSALNAACIGKDQNYKPGWDEYGLQGKWLSDILTVIQSGAYTNFIFITHVQVLEDDDKKDVYVPLCGTKSFSFGVSKYFGTVIYAEMKVKKHKAGSSTAYNSTTQAGSRINLLLEKESDPDLSVVLPKAGLFNGESTTVSVEQKAATTVVEPVVKETPTETKPNPFKKN